MWIKNHKSPRTLACLLALLLFAFPLSAHAAGADLSNTLPLPRPSAPHLPMTLPAAAPAEEQLLLPGGMPFGVRMQTKGVMVVGLTEVVSERKTTRPAYEGGVREKDLLIAVNGKEVTTAEQATAAIAAAGGAPLTLTVLRDGARADFTVTPRKCDKDGVWRLGIYLRDSASGIGTVTFIDPQSGLFGGLGHGVCDADTGELVPLSRGRVLAARITGVEQGKAGKPGQLHGSLGPTRLGALFTNSECGVFGVLTSPPACDRTPLPVCPAAEVEEGEASILCTLGDDGVREYRVEISNIDRGGRPTKSFRIRVTDSTLLARTGGIVQGMSGSPIIQNGKIVGAVTHVLVDDPTSGYGIFIENMLSQMKLRAAA